MKILVTGAAGFIGMSMTLALTNLEHEVVGIDNINDYYPKSLKYDRLQRCGIERSNIRYNVMSTSKTFANYRFMKLNLEDASGIQRLFLEEKFDLVLNFAAQAGVRYSLEEPMSYVKSNIEGFLNILEACRYTNVPKLMYASSSSVYGKNEKLPFAKTDRVDSPINMYAVSKKTNELMAHTYSHLYGFTTVGFRFFTVYGPWGRPDMAPFLFADSIVNDKPINVFNHGKLSRDFTYIDDIISGLLSAVSTTFHEPYNIFNLGNSKPVELLYFINCLEKGFGKKAVLDFVDMQPGDLATTWADISDFELKVGYKPVVEIDEGVRHFTDWYKAYFLV